MWLMHGNVNQFFYKTSNCKLKLFINEFPTINYSFVLT